MDLVSAAERHSRPLYFNSTSWPLTSICGARPGEKMRSLTCPLDLSIAAMSCAVGMTRCAGGVWVEVSMGRVVLVRKATKGSLEDRSMSRPANSLSMRDFGDTAWNAETIGCEKIKCRSGDNAAAGARKRRAAARRGQT